MVEWDAIVGAAMAQSRAVAARRYVEAGLAVLPVAAAGKRPLTSHGLRDASSDVDVVRNWWRRWPEANVGIATGGTGIDVVDIDHRPSGSGFAAVARPEVAALVDGWAVRVQTPSNGAHLYFPAAGGQRSWALNRAHVDFRGDGGYVIAPPSELSTGRYTVAGRQAQAGPVDAVGLRAVLAPPPAAGGSAPAGIGRGVSDRLAAWVASRPEGTRNDALFWAACRYAESAVDPQEAQEVLGAAARSAGLGVAETAATIRSAYRTQPPDSTRRPRSAAAGRGLGR